MENLITYHWCGKFKSPTSEWIHMTRNLNEHELFFVTEGTLYIADTQGKYVVSKDEYLLMPPTDKQYGYAPSDCTFFWFHFTPSSISTQDDIIIPQQSKIPNIERIIILMNQLREADRRYHHRYTLDLLATGLIMELYNQIQSKENGDTLTTKAHLYQAILDYVQWNRFTRISVMELSEYFGYHEKYLSSVFKSIAGISLKQYLLQEIMEHAKAELINSNKTIAQIGYSIGYTDSHNFSNAFKKVTGISPSAYRNSCTRLPKTPD
jgi:AraC-like DNA-binding protein